MTRTVRAWRALAPDQRLAATAAIALFLTLFLGWVWSPLLYLGIALTGWCIYFFRDPPRFTPTSPGVIVSPADGRIASVSRPASRVEIAR